MINPTQYITISDDIPYVTMQMIEEAHTANEVEQFCNWFGGQTGIVLEDGTLGIYVSDYERWVRQGMQTEQGSDWD